MSHHIHIFYVSGRTDNLSFEDEGERDNLFFSMRAAVKANRPWFTHNKKGDGIDKSYLINLSNVEAIKMMDIKGLAPITG